MSLTMIANMRRIEPRAEVFSLYLDRDVLPGQPGGYACELTLADAVYNVSKLDGEDGWIIDGKWTLSGLPIFFNGEGARYTMLHKIADADIVEQLDAAAAGYERSAVAS